MKRYMPALIWSALVVIAFNGLIVLSGIAPKVIFTSYQKSPQFQSQMETAYKNLDNTVLNPLSFEVAEKKLTVTPEEIATYRSYYGTLGEQVDSIQMEYEERIQEAESKPTVKQVLIDERDAKIEEIQKKFKDDTYVENKILEHKKSLLDTLLQDYNSRHNSTIPVFYRLTPVGGGETYTNWEAEDKFGYKRQFNANTGYLKIEGTNMDLVDSGIDSYPLPGGEGIELSQRDLKGIFPTPITYEGEIAVPLSAFQEGGVLYEEVKNYNFMKVILSILGVAGIAAFISLLTVRKFKWEWFADLPMVRRYNNLRIDVKFAIFLFLLFWLVIFSEVALQRMHIMVVESYSFILTDEIFKFVIQVSIVALLTFQVGNAITRYREPGILNAEIKRSLAMKIFSDMRDVFINRSIAVQTFLLLIGFFLAGVGFAGAMFGGELLFIYICCVLFLGLPILFLYMRRMGYLSRIMKATEEMAAGKLHSNIPVRGRSSFAAHATNLNNLREGVERSISSQAKSERMKTELITNVSHDLRTPLTSIITYTDLLKKKDLTEEERAEYVDVLDRKSQRLKTLIEDLFEVSKMSSGTMELYKQRVDLTQLVHQAIGEHTEKMADIPLDFRVSLPEGPVSVYVDGQRWWRMLDNLLGNALKYSLPGTRVYVTLREVDGIAEFVIKNITAYELNENTDELYERFKRGDASRHTDGSGLGLAIAQSIVSMHGGAMAIDVDGDLFKVTVRIPLVS